MFVPEQFGNPVTCVMHGQAYLAETSIGQEIGQDERVKIVCVRNASAARTVGSLRSRRALRDLHRVRPPIRLSNE